MNRRYLPCILQLMSLYVGLGKLRKRGGVHRIRRLREQRGAFFTLLPELKKDPAEFKKFTRMSLPAFEKLLETVKPSLKRKSIRAPICPEQRLLVCLRYLATGNSFTSLAFTFFLGETTVREVVHSTCQALADALRPIYLRTPNTEKEWLAVAAEFNDKWQMPNCLGAVDGKHVRMRAPNNSGSLYFNYKGHFSTVLMAVADASCRIIYASFGSYGHENDAGIFDRSDFGRAMKDAANPLHIPAAHTLPNSDLLATHFFIGDDAFPHHKHLMKPFRQNKLNKERRIYNYRLSRARRVVESAFGILASKWRILLRAIDITPARCDILVQAVCCLHNYLIEEGDIANVGGGDVEDPTAVLPQARNIRQAHANNAGNAADATRKSLIEYFNGVGAVEWQDEYAHIDLLADNSQEDMSQE